jgi:O-antigen/teichoic acid export membrane protein
MFLKNGFFSILSTIFNFIAPVIVLPIMAKSLCKQDLGLVLYQESIAKYLSVILLLGIPLYGVRELGQKFNGTMVGRSSFVWSMVLLQIIVLVGVCILYLSIAEFNEINVITLLIGITGAFSFDWVLYGLEEFKSLALRGIVIKLIYVLLVLNFIKEEDDSINVLYILLFTNLLYISWNLYVLRETLNLREIEIQLMQHLRPMIIVFGSLMVVTFYTMFDVILLGELSNLKEVAIYNVGLRLPRALTTGMSAVLLVFIPRLNNYYRNNEGDFKKALKLSLDFILILTIPLFLLLFINADTIVSSLTSSEFYGDSVIVLRILSPLPLLIGISNLLGIQLLTTCRFEAGLLYASFVGALISVVINVIYIPVNGAFGASVANLSAEAFVIIILLIYAHKKNVLSWIDFRNISCSRVSILIYFIVFVTMLSFSLESVTCRSVLNTLTIIGVGANIYRGKSLIMGISSLN